MRNAFLSLFILITFSGCNSSDEPSIVQDNYDREAMLINWADNIIIPGYDTYVNDLTSLVEAKDAFKVNISEANLSLLKTAWLNAYISWQKVSMFEIGKAETLTLRDYTNIFPANAAEIEANISTGVYDLALPSKRDEQGFPAIDYMLNGLAITDAETANFYSLNNNHLQYLNAIIDRLFMLGSEVNEDWKNGYRDVFVANSGSSSSSSVNKLVNDFMYYYERSLRAGKIGIPAGVFSNTPLSDKVEAIYIKNKSKLLFETSLQATVDFFNGVHYDGISTGRSLSDYLESVHTAGATVDLAELINQQFDVSISKGAVLEDNFINQVETNNQAMLEVFNALQENVVLMKVDMFQALNIRVDFVDADGD
jgi:hypothetical protein